MIAGWPVFLVDAAPSSDFSSLVGCRKTRLGVRTPVEASLCFHSPVYAPLFRTAPSSSSISSLAFMPTLLFLVIRGVLLAPRIFDTQMDLHGNRGFCLPPFSTFFLLPHPSLLLLYSHYFPRLPHRSALLYLELKTREPK